MTNVPLYLDLLGALPGRYPGFFKRFGDLETKLLSYDLINLKIEKPVFIGGLARSGSTILLEVLNSHPDFAAHQYRDFPFLHVNYFWNTLRRLIPSNPQKVERAHKDRIMINAQSPEAMDEILWISFFDQIHNPKTSSIMNAQTNNPAFEKFYRDHILKLLFLRKSKRFVSKNNYNVPRLSYLKKIFPDAKFVIPIRRAEDHVYSLLKQNRMMRIAQETSPRDLRFMQRHGHFEFGLDFRPMHFGDADKADKILSLWRQGDFMQSYALYWVAVHDYLYQTLAQNPNLKSCCLIIRYDDLCANPSETLRTLFEFCDTPEAGMIDKWKNEISAPAYYSSDLTQDEKNMIANITGKTEKLLWP